ncbi:MAG: chromosome segregation protein, partial [Flavobacteriaceae bacterium]|nr:chromosome segregation protein [Flavobacteriaceae bacterium]
MSEKQLNEDPQAPTNNEVSKEEKPTDNVAENKEATLENAMTEETEAVSGKGKPAKKETEESHEDAANAIIEESAANRNEASEVSDVASDAEGETQITSEEDSSETSSVTAEEEDEEEISSSDDSEDEEEEESKDYSALSEKELIAEFRELLGTKPVQNIKNEVEEIRAEFNSKFNEEVEQKKEDFLADGGNLLDFYYTTPLKKEFDSLFFEYKEKRNNHYKNLKRDLQANLSKRLELIEELKSLLNAEENINTTYKHFKDIQDRWHTAGPIPRDKYNFVWNNYHHHVENFYDFLHLNREFRDLDFKHNLDQKLKLIGRAEELAKLEDVSRAFRELQMLHKMWKEE